MRVCRMQFLAQAVDNPRVDASQLRERVVQFHHVGGIRDTDAEPGGVRSRDPS